MKRGGLGNRNSGLIKFILAVILVVIILVYFRVDIKDLLESERLQRLVGVFIGLVKQAFAVFRDVLLRVWQQS